MNHADKPALRLEPCAKRLRVVFNGETLVDSCAARLLYEPGRIPVYYFPRSALRQELLKPSQKQSHCPRKGTASYWTLQVKDRQAENAVWAYDGADAAPAGIGELAAFAWDRMDHWYEEDEEVFVHARDPYVRIDCLASSRRVRVLMDGHCVADSRRAVFLFETGLPTRYYIPPEDIEGDLLAPSDTTSACPYKGTANYYSLRLGGADYPDIAWSYRNPLPECAAIKDHLAFFQERIEAIELAGQRLERPRTKWS